MKKNVLTIALLCTVLFLHAQSQTSPVTKVAVSIDKIDRAALSISFNADDEDVEDVIKNEIKQYDGKVKKDDGFILGKHVKKSPLSDNDLDVLWKIDSKGRKKNEVSTVVMAVRQMDGLYLSDSLNNDTYTKAYAYLSELPHKVEIYQKDKELTALKEQLKKVTEDMKDLQKSSSSDKKAFGKKTKELDDLTEKINSLQKANN